MKNIPRKGSVLRKALGQEQRQIIWRINWKQWNGNAECEGDSRESEVLGARHGPNQTVIVRLGSFSLDKGMILKVFMQEHATVSQALGNTMAAVWRMEKNRVASDTRMLICLLKCQERPLPVEMERKGGFEVLGGQTASTLWLYMATKGEGMSSTTCWFLACGAGWHLVCVPLLFLKGQTFWFCILG